MLLKVSAPVVVRPKVRLFAVMAPRLLMVAPLVVRIRSPALLMPVDKEFDPIVGEPEPKSIMATVSVVGNKMRPASKVLDGKVRTGLIPLTWKVNAAGNLKAEKAVGKSA